MVNAKDKYLALKRIVDYYPSIFAIIFCRTKRETQEIADKLIHDGYNAEALHGDLSQQQRDLTMQKFRKHTTQFLVATDVAARGLDVDDLTHVINFGLPDDIESYTHRSGRTGRAGKKGTSISIIHTRERSKMHAIEKVISKAFVEADIPDAKAICSKQLYKVMDQILKTDVNEEEITPFLSEINRHFEYVDKEDIIKKIVSMEFGKFLEYYANAPVIEKPSRGRGEERGSKGNRRDGNGQRRGGERRAPRAVESGFKRLFINLGKTDGFYPGEIMQFINKNVKGRQQVGHIDLLDKISYIEVPERDANKVMKALNGSIYKNREVRCNDAEEGSNGRRGRSTGGRNAGGDSDNRYEKRSRQRNSNGERRQGGRNSKGYYTERGEESGDWRQFFNDKKVNLRGEEPDFSEDGWARRKPKKK
jgi:ATP-dependent RNA helicase deaD